MILAAVHSACLSAAVFDRSLCVCRYVHAVRWLCVYLQCILPFPCIVALCLVVGADVDVHNMLFSFV